MERPHTPTLLNGNSGNQGLDYHQIDGGGLSRAEAVSRRDRRLMEDFEVWVIAVHKIEAEAADASFAQVDLSEIGERLEQF